MKQPPKPSKKPKRAHPSVQFRESRRALEAETYREGFNDGYKMGLAEGKLQQRG